MSQDTTIITGNYLIIFSSRRKKKKNDIKIEKKQQFLYNICVILQIISTQREM